MNLINFKNNLFKIPFDNRLKAIGLTSLFSAITRIIQLFTGLIMVPLTLNYLGEERYGLMMTIISFLGIISFADLGMGMGVQNKIPELIVKGKDDELKELISGVFFLLVIIVSILILVFFIFLPFISWDKFFNIPIGKYGNETNLSIIIFFLCLIISLPFGIAQRIQDGFQQGYLNQIWLSASTLIGFILVYFSIKLNYSLPVLILCIYGVNTIFIILNFANLFLRNSPHLLPRFKKIDTIFYKNLFFTGITFFILQITNLIFQSVDPLIIAKTLSLKDVTSYSIGIKLVNILILPVQIIIPTFLPAFNEAIAKNEFSWIRKIIIHKFIFIIFLSTVTACFLFFFSNKLIHFWINNTINLSTEFIFALCIYVYFMNFNLLYSYIGLSSIFVKNTAKYYLIAVLASITLKFVFLPFFGIPGTIWINLMCFSILFFLPLTVLFKKSKILF